MKIALCIGHSRLKNGCYTSADGTKFGGINEYKYNKWMYRYIAKYLRKQGHAVDIVICPEKKFSTKHYERGYKLNIINNGNYNLVIELHLNADGKGSANGCEVLYKSLSGKRYAESICNNLGTIFKNRGAKKHKKLYMLNDTKPTAIIIETFFCTNKEDCKKGKKYNTIGKAIAGGITDA